MINFLNDIRNAENPISNNRKLINTIAILFLGIALGTFSKYLDFRQTELPGVLMAINGVLDIGNFLGRFAIWILIALCISKLATTSSTGGLSLALQRAIVTARPKGRYRKHFYWPAIKRYYWNLLFSIPLLAHLYISELLHLLYCRLFQHNIL